jgi:hypothetical protein
MLDRILARLGLCRTRNVIEAATTLRQHVRTDVPILDRTWVAFIREAQGRS